jgi:hypothetical protein
MKFEGSTARRVGFLAVALATASMWFYFDQILIKS